jgi:hypothetical protein
MLQTAQQCFRYGVVVLIVGALAVTYIPDLVVGLANLAGSNATLGLSFINIVLNIIRLSLLPAGTALLTAGLILRSLARSQADAGPAAAGSEQ